MIPGFLRIVIMFDFLRPKPVKKTYDTTEKSPAIRVSICTGEQVAGFRDIHTGAFEEIMLIKDQADLDRFRKSYGIKTEIERIY